MIYHLLTLTIIFICCSSCHGQVKDGYDNTVNQIFYVTPTTNNVCPRDPCFTLSHYSRNQHIYFCTNAKLHFLPGVHRLNEQILLEGTTNFTTFTLVGGESGPSKIVFTGQAALKLADIKSVVIESLQFSGNYDLNISNTERLVAINLQFTSINGRGFTFENISNITATNIALSNSFNASSVGVFKSSNGVFTNLTVMNNSCDSVVTINQSFIQFREVNIFGNNTAKKYSSLLVANSTVTFTGFTEFTQSRCEKEGGSMNIINSTVVLRDWLELSGNSAIDSGGAVQLTHSVLLLQGSIDVINNSITQSTEYVLFGGAISSIESNITIHGRVTFSNNHIAVSYSTAFGGAIGARRSTLFLSGIMNFHHNYIRSFISHGGAILLSNSSLVATDVNFTFTENSALNGGAIALTARPDLKLTYLSTLSVKGNTLFEANSAEYFAGGLLGNGLVDIRFIGDTTFDRNGESQAAFSQASGGQVLFSGWTEIKGGYSQSCKFTRGTFNILNNVHVAFNGTTTFVNNTCSAGIMSIKHASVVFLGHSYFLKNHGDIIVVQSSNLSLISEQALFQENELGTTIIAQTSTVKLEGDSIQFTRNSIGCINLIQSNITINGTVTMMSNRASVGPGINSFDSRIHMYGDYQFSKNTASGDGGLIFAIRSDIHFDGPTFKFIENKAARGGAMYVIDSSVYLSGHHTFITNNAVTGGMINLGFNSVIHFEDLNMTCINNTAERGAIIYVDDMFSSVDCMDNSAVPASRNPTTIRSQCFYTKANDVNIVHSGNVARNVGSVLFGGNLKRCNVVLADKKFIRLFHINASLNEITSNPYQIVFCNQSKINLFQKDVAIKAVPGKLFSVTVAGLDQIYQLISSTIRAEFPAESNYTARLAQFQSKQTTNNSCTELNYRIYTQASRIELILYAEGSCNKLGTASKTALIQLGPCPDGFQLVGDECTCATELLKYTSVCNVDDGSILNNGDFWAGGLYKNGSYVGVILFPHCPFDYCTEDAVNFTLSDPDTQCAHSRSGIICGQCRFSYSFKLGGSGCSRCSSNYLVTFGLLFLFALIGLLLVVLLMLLKLTVAFGTLNGLIFYANIVGANKDIFIPQEGPLRLFISWLNLDFGFSVCFYNGMDTYAHTWMQFLFPFYIWMLIGIIIVISHYSIWMTKKLGSNPVAVLATLILLSYAKLLRTVITVFYFARLQLPHGHTSTVWLYDGNISYLHGKHIPLFIFALLFFVFIFLPYNLLLILGSWLQKVSGEKINESHGKALLRKSFVGWYSDYRIQSFMLAYTAPYSVEYEFWTGMFLMLRCVLFLVFANNALGDASTNLLAITTTTFGVLVLTRVFNGRIYGHRYVDFLEALFLLNLGVLSSATYYTMLTGGNQQAVAGVSVGTTFVLFLGIVAYHALKQIVSSNLYKVVTMKLINLFHLIRNIMINWKTVTNNH